MHIIENTEGNGHPTYYGYIDRLFEIHELKMLMDAVTAARFIPMNDTRNLLNKIKKLTSKNLARKLNNQLYIDENLKVKTLQVRYSIDKIHNSIASRTEIHFQYGRYDLNKKIVLSKDGQTYHVKPYALLWHNDFYYLIGKYNSTNEIRHFRVDRLVNVQETSIPYTTENFDIKNYMPSVFNMYGGETEEEIVKINVKNSLLNAMIDRFGLGIDLKIVNSDTFQVRFKAKVNEGLKKWVMEWGCEVEVVSPESLRSDIKKEISKMIEIYNIQN
jgi:predicted DNA-binding transcriptional regulator YafY